MIGKISNVDIITEQGRLCDAALFMENGKITYVGRDNADFKPDQVWDGQGMTLVPGFIDLHVHGGDGYDFMDHTEEAMNGICRFHAAHGTTSLLVTTMTAPLDELEKVLTLCKSYLPSEGAQVLGVHVEGPFINKQYKGAQNEEWIISPSISNINRLWDVSGEHLIRMVTLAPELVDGPLIFEWLLDKKVIVSIGHSDLDYAGGCSCIRKGVSHATHLGNAMRPFHHRNIGIIGLVMEQPALTFDVIADGIHVAPELIRLLTRICGREQMMLITDAMRGAGLPCGNYELGGQEVIVREGQARLPSGALAGSLLTLDCGLSNLMKFTGLSLDQAINYLTINPAKKLGVEVQKGSIKVGKDADLVLLSRSINVEATWVGGRLVFQRKKASH